MRLAWERRPLQLVIFGDQLAGEHFFDRLEALRSAGGARLPALQVFHMCLLIGFRGKHALDASDKLSYLTARLGDEIAHMQGRSKGFAPQAERPDQIVHKLRSNTAAVGGIRRVWGDCAGCLHRAGVVAVQQYAGVAGRIFGSGEAGATPGLRHHHAALIYCATRNSMRRLRERPSAVEFSATGRSGPWPETITISWLMPFPAR